MHKGENPPPTIVFPRPLVCLYLHDPHLTDVLVAHDVPHPVAGEHQELVLVPVALPDVELGLGGDELLSGALHEEEIKYESLNVLERQNNHNQSLILVSNYDWNTRMKLTKSQFLKSLQHCLCFFNES